MRKDALRLMEMDVKRASGRNEWPEWLMTAMGMAWLALFPFWQDGSYMHITRAKWIGMMVLTAATIVCAAAAVVLMLAQGRSPRFGWVQAAGLAYFTLVALSAWLGSWADHCGEDGRLTVIWGAYRHEGLITQLCYGAVFLCMSAVRVKLRPLLHAAAAGLLAYGAFTALQYAGVNVLGLFPEGRSIRTNYEFQGPIGNIDMVVGYVAVVMPAVLGGFVRLYRRRTDWLWLAAGLTGAALLLFMEVQCGLIMLAALLFMLLLMALQAPACRWRALLVLSGVLALAGLRMLTALPWLDGVQALSVRPRWQALLPLMAATAAALGAWWAWLRPGRAVSFAHTALLSGVLIASVLLAVYLLPTPEGNALWELRELLHGRPQDSFGSERIGIWRLTLELCRENLLWGTGPDAFLHAMDHHLLETGQRLVQRFDNPHNLFLGVLVNSGVPALGLYLTLVLGAPAWAALHHRDNGCLAPLTLAVLCYIVQGMFTFSICLVTPMFWAALGMLAAGLNERMTQE